MIIRHIGIFASSAIRRLLGEITEPIEPIEDALFSDVVLNVRGDGVSGSTAFTDYSPLHNNVYTGGTPRVSNEQQLFGLNTVKFDGTSYLQVDILGGLGTTSGASFTVEFFFYPTSSSGYLFNSRTGGSGGDGFELRLDGQATTSGIYLLGGGWLTPNLNTWNFVQVVCNQGAFKAYLNGVESMTGASPSNVFNGTHINLFGSPQGNTGFMTGYGANFRITRAARTDHSVPTAPFYGVEPPFVDDNTDPLWDKVAISGSFTGVTSDDTFVDRKLNIYEFYNAYQNTVSLNSIGRKAIQFNGANGSGVRVQTPVGHPAHDLGTKNWSLECWVSPSGQGTQSPGYILNLGGGYQYSHGAVAVWYTGDGQLGWSLASANVASTPDIKNYTAVGTLPLNQWNHVEVTRAGSSFYLFMNGQLVDQATSSAPMLVTSLAGLGIGCGAYTDLGLSPKEVLNGYVSDVRLTVDAVRHTSNFTIEPTRFFPVGDVTPDSGDGYRYYRVNVSENNGDTYTALQEVVLYDKNRIQVSSKFVPTFDGGHYNSNSAKYAFDGDLINYGGSAWITNGVAAGYLGIDLVHRTEVSTLVMYQQAFSNGSTRAPKNFTFEGSNDATTWDVIKSFSDVTGWQSGISKEFEISAVNNTSLLLHMDGDSGSTTFLDSSGWNNSVQSNGVAVTTAYKKFGTGSANITTGGYLAVTPSSNFNFGNLPFTIEFQMNPAGYGSGAIFSGRINSNIDAPIEFRLSGPNTFQCYMAYPSSTGTGGWFSLGGFTVPVNMSTGSWYHVALVGTGSVLRLFVDGQEANSTTAYTAIANNYQPLYIGRGGDGQFNGFLDEFRITKAALYTANFTPPTQAFGTTTPVEVPDPITDQNILVLNMDGAAGSTSFVDTSPYARSLTPYSATISSQLVSSGQSGDFTGSESKLLAGATSDFDFGSGDFTIEGTFMITQASGTYQLIYEQTYGSGKRIAIRFGDGGFGTRLQFCTLDSATGTAFRPTGDPTTTSMLNTVQNFAMVRYNGRLLVFLNGIQQNLNSEQGEGVEATKAWGDIISVTTSVAIGGSSTYSNCGMRGYMDEFRVTKGLARYTANYTVATTPFPSTDPIPEVDPYGDNVVLLLHMDGENGSTSFVDSSGTNKTVTARDKTAITTASPIMGSGSGTFNTNVGGLTVSPVNDFNFGSLPFTIECTAKFGSFLAEYPQALFTYTHNPQYSPVELMVPSSNVVLMSVAVPQSGIALYHNVAFDQNVDIPVGVPRHFALVGDGAFLRLFVNGIEATSSSGPFPYTYLADSQIPELHIGWGHSQIFDMVMDEFRVTRGIARYTENFTPRTTPFPDPIPDPLSSKVVMMLHGEGSSVVDSGSTGVTVYNGVAPSTSQYKIGSSSLAFLNTNSYLRFNNPSKLAFKDKDFTIEGWYRFNNGEGNVQQVMYFNYQSVPFGDGSIFFGKHPTYSGKVSFWAGSQSMAGALMVDDTYPANNTWVHYAINRTGNKLTMYRDGVQVATATVTGSLTGETVEDGYIGAGENNGFQGYLDEFRVTVGAGRYPVAFAPPVKPGTDPT